ncbi:MAG TPA: type II CAAX endopeptidase family protein [Propionibacteriaceae bacterium]|nr:type II CAAX endopeptidase family protein [Propionibacteriaceae bacterium]
MSTTPLTATPVRTQSLVRRHPLISFFVLTYVVTWTLWAPLVVFRDQIPGPLVFVLIVLGSNVPSVLGVLFVALLRGRSGVRILLGRLLRARIGLRWYVAAVALAVPALCAVWVSTLLGGPSPVVVTTISAVVVSFLFSIFPGSAVGEELGWRGFALPRLQARHSALAASLIVGAAWGIYHLPLFLLGSPTRPLALFLPFAIGCVIMSILYTWMYNGTGGSLLIVVLLHATTNLPLIVVYAPLGERVVPVFWLLDAMLAIIAAVLIARTGAATLSRARGKQIETP